MYYIIVSSRQLSCWFDRAPSYVPDFQFSHNCPERDHVKVIYGRVSQQICCSKKMSSMQLKKEKIGLEYITSTEIALLPHYSIPLSGNQVIRKNTYNLCTEFACNLKFSFAFFFGRLLSLLGSLFYEIP